MDCIIEWNSLPLNEWENRFAKIRRTNLLQSYDYACAICPAKSQRARWGLIRIEGNEAGLVQLLEAGAAGLHALQLDRGPLWLPGYGREEHHRAFYATFARTFPRRFLRWRRVLPEAATSDSLQTMMTGLGYRRLDRPGYATIWIDLDKDEETLRSGLKRNWRNHLNGAEKAGFDMVWDWTGKQLPLLLTHYETHKTTKGYEGPSSKILQVLAKRFIPGKKMLTGTATLNGELAGTVLFFLHGTSATYQTGWASDPGKKKSAFNIMLWQAFGLLKQQGIKDLDLGGVNDESAAGVKLFKEGMGGELVTCLGQYR